jgi:hypothetical protein
MHNRISDAKSATFVSYTLGTGTRSTHDARNVCVPDTEPAGDVERVNDETSTHEPNPETLSHADLLGHCRSLCGRMQPMPRACQERLGA